MESTDYKKYIIISFVAGIIFSFLSFISFWNRFIHEHATIGILPLILSVLSVAAFSMLFYYTQKATDKQIFEHALEEKVGEEKAKIFAELNKEEERVEEEKDEQEYREIAEKLIPSGKFEKIEGFMKKLLVNLMDELNGVQGIAYKRDDEKFQFVEGYGLTNEEPISSFVSGEGLNGEAVRNGRVMIVGDIPENYFCVESGLGKAKVGSLVLVPIVYKGESIGLIEFASFKALSDGQIKILNEFSTCASNKFYQLISA